MFGSLTKHKFTTAATTQLSEWAKFSEWQDISFQPSGERERSAGTAGTWRRSGVAGSKPAEVAERRSHTRDGGECPPPPLSAIRARSEQMDGHLELIDRRLDLFDGHLARITESLERVVVGNPCTAACQDGRPLAVPEDEADNELTLQSIAIGVVSPHGWGLSPH